MRKNLIDRDRVSSHRYIESFSFEQQPHPSPREAFEDGRRSERKRIYTLLKNHCKPEPEVLDEVWALITGEGDSGQA